MSRLPAGLEPWGEALQVLDVELLVGLAPMLRAVEALLTRHEQRAHETGDPNGYDGMTTRGVPERLLMSEWLMAQEAPEEFLRRAAHRELLHLKPAFTQPRSGGEHVVLVDAGPQQHGVPRLVQLAILIVVKRRSSAAGSGLRVGILGDPADRWLVGVLGHVLTTWRQRRQPTGPTVGDIEARLVALTAEGSTSTTADHLWLVAGPTLAAQPHEVRHVITVTEGAYSAAGVSEATVHYDGERVELPLPHHSVAVQALRTAQFRSNSAPSLPYAAPPPGAVRHPLFASTSPRLLLRGVDDRDVWWVNARSGDERLRHTRFPGPVIAAAWLGKRLLALTLEAGRLRVRHVGRRMGDLELIDVAATEPLSTTTAEQSVRSGLAALHVSGQGVFVSLGDKVIRIDARFVAHIPWVLTMAVGAQVDAPRQITHHQGIASVHGVGTAKAPATRGILGHGTFAALSADGCVWTMYDGSVRLQETIEIDGGATVLGVLPTPHGPALMHVASGGLLVRWSTAHHTHTLTELSGSLSRPALHPTLPLLAVQPEPDLVLVAHPVTGDVIRRIRPR